MLVAAITLIGGPWLYIRTHPDWRSKIPTPVLAATALVAGWDPPMNDAPSPSLKTELALRIYHDGAEGVLTNRVFDRWMSASIELFEGPEDLHVYAPNLAWIQSEDSRTVRSFGGSDPHTLISRGRFADGTVSDWVEVGADSNGHSWFWINPIGSVQRPDDSTIISVDLLVVPHEVWSTYIGYATGYKGYRATIEEVVASATHEHQLQSQERVRSYRRLAPVDDDELRSLVRDSVRVVDESKIHAICLGFRPSGPVANDLSLGIKATLLDAGRKIAMQTVWNDDGMIWGGGAIVVWFYTPGLYYRDLEDDQNDRFTLRIEGVEAIAAQHPTATRYWNGSIEIPVSEILGGFGWIIGLDEESEADD